MTTPRSIDLRAVLAEATRRLAEAGVPSPEYDAAELLAHVLDTSRARLFAVETVNHDQLVQLGALVDRRARREPLQHLTGVAHFRHVSLGTGSGAIAAAVADEVPAARVHALELDEGAHEWAARNLAGTGVDLRQGDLATAFDDLIGQFDVIASNPPYIPLTAWESVAPEVRDHDPELALWSGGDGLDTIRVLEARAAVLLRDGGVIGVEHADVQGESAPAVFSASGRWTEVKDHHDLAGRPRFLTARLAR
jgi:release factor glutamine methyltransferase